MALADVKRLVRDPELERHEGWLDDQSAFEVLRSAGFDVVPWKTVRSAAACARAGAELGLPCVVKAIVQDVVHKSDVGAVVTGVTTRTAAAAAYRSLVRRFGTAMSGAIVQHQAEPGLELLVGIVRDERFGPMVVVAAGGTNAEILADRVVLVPPVTSSAARRGLDQLRLAPLLHGYRGRARLDVDGVVHAITRLSVLGVAVPEITELDVNPLIVGPTGVTAVDVRIRVAAPPIASPPLRGLSVATTS
jgi:hypothetical protein